MTQPDLFDICARKHGGNEHSVAANERAPKEKDKERVLWLIRSAQDGVTLTEACAAMGKEKNQLSGRFSELKREGLIYQAGRRDGCGVWRLVETQSQYDRTVK